MSSIEGPGRKPAWLRKPLPEVGPVRRMERLLRERELHTVCESARCPNVGECFARGTATFLIMGDVCTRDCSFCAVRGGEPRALDATEPAHVADAAAQLDLRHVVITSVTRDDLADGGARHFVETIRAVRGRCPSVTVEVLVPDFLGKVEHVELVLAEEPEVFNHNVETVPRLYPPVRPRAAYETSLAVLLQAVRRGTSLVKTGLMVGLGETEEEVESVLGEVAEAGVQVVTVGQYLRPSRESAEVAEYVPLDTFERYRRHGEALGMQMHCSPFVRSSFRAGESYLEAGKRCV